MPPLCDGRGYGVSPIATDVLRPNSDRSLTTRRRAATTLAPHCQCGNTWMILTPIEYPADVRTSSSCAAMQPRMPCGAPGEPRHGSAVRVHVRTRVVPPDRRRHRRTRTARRPVNRRRRENAMDMNRASCRILGCHVVEERAVEIAQLAAVAIAADMRVDDLARVAVSFPTYAEVLIHAAMLAAVDSDCLEQSGRTTAANLSGCVGRGPEHAAADRRAHLYLFAYRSPGRVRTGDVAPAHIRCDRLPRPARVSQGPRRRALRNGIRTHTIPDSRRS